MDYNRFVYSQNLNPGHYGVSATILFLQKMFSSNPEFGFEVYTDESNKETAFESLWIGAKYVWEEKYRNKRPAIFVSRGNIITGVNNTIGQGKLFSITKNGEITSYLDLVSFPIMVECLSESDLQSEALAAMVTAFLSLDQRPFKSLGFQIQGSPTITPPQIFEKGNTSFISSVIIQIQIQRMYKAKVLSNQALQEIQVILNNSQTVNIT